MIEVTIPKKSEFYRGVFVENTIPREVIVSSSKRNIKINQKKSYGDVQDTIRENVRMILNNYPLSRKSDLVLYLEYLKFTSQIKITTSKDDIIIRIKKDNLLSLTASESVSRARRELQESHEVETDPETEKFRKLKEEEIRGYFTAIKTERDYVPEAI